MLEVIDQIAESDILVLNGLTRLLHALKYSCGYGISDQLLKKADEILEMAGEDFFPEVKNVYQSYLQALRKLEDVGDY